MRHDHTPGIPCSAGLIRHCSWDVAAALYFARSLARHFSPYGENVTLLTARSINNPRGDEFGVVKNLHLALKHETGGK
jgi:hypothetical protein